MAAHHLDDLLDCLSVGAAWREYMPPPRPRPSKVREKPEVMPGLSALDERILDALIEHGDCYVDQLCEWAEGRSSEVQGSVCRMRGYGYVRDYQRRGSKVLVWHITEKGRKAAVTPRRGENR